MKVKKLYQCRACGTQTGQWQGKCFSCGEWDTLEEQAIVKKSASKHSYAGQTIQQAVCLDSVQAESLARITTGWQECDRVLGGGLVPGSVLLVGGDPGVGKSTLLLEMLCYLGKKSNKTLYVTGEESADQVALRAERMQLDRSQVWIFPATDLGLILEQIKQTKAAIVVIDSIQTMAHSELSQAAGSVSQVRECAMQLTQMAKQQQVTVILVGHVTKDGHVAGPRVLEHMVDTVLYLEGEQTGRYRLLRAIKNRFGAVHELGVFAMLEQGLKEVKHPSLLFLSKDTDAQSGSTITSTWEGSRALLVELQTLVDESYGQNPRRVVMGLDQQRVNMLLAILHKHAKVACHQYDIFINVVGGLKIQETSADLALCLAIFSSLTNMKLPRDLVVMGELGLNGEVRPIQQGQARVQAALQHGIKHIIIPAGNKLAMKNISANIYFVKTVAEAKAILIQLGEKNYQTTE
ncbi:MAG: DNA repair protein RadA [Pseudomonadota bacterium]|nr:DNA repair protein RadA [Pseudomonadota bacterium]